MFVCREAQANTRQAGASSPVKTAPVNIMPLCSGMCTDKTQNSSDDLPSYEHRTDIRCTTVVKKTLYAYAEKHA